MDKYFDDFRMNMKFYREQAGFSQTYLSILCNCGTGTIGGIESGKAKPSFDMMIKIANALNINPADFFIRNASKNKNELRKSLESEFDSILNKYI
jgi:transcriptional regulator with XRE-family HTH domain